MLLSSTSVGTNVGRGVGTTVQMLLGSTSVGTNVGRGVGTTVQMLLGSTNVGTSGVAHSRVPRAYPAQPSGV